MTAVAARPSDRFTEQFRAFRGEEASHEPSWMQEMRERALEDFERRGFPTTRDEDWKYTSLTPMLKVPFEMARRSSSSAGDLCEQVRLRTREFEGHVAVFVNGMFCESLSTLSALPPGVSLSSMADALRQSPERLEAWMTRVARQDGNAFVSLNTAFTTDGAFLHVAAGVKVDRPIGLLFVSSAATGPVASHPRVLVVAERDSRVDLVETFTGRDDEVYLTNAVADIVVEEGARVDFYKVGLEGVRAYHVETLRFHTSARSRISACTLSLGGGLVRNEVHAPMDAEHVEARLLGLYVVRGTQHVDNHIVVEHARPHCHSEQVYKGILDEEARGVFSGAVTVQPDAQKTVAHQTNKNLLLSEDALVDTRPQLQIHADDVKCTHGVAIGHLEEESLFYLRSRGIGEAEARAILTFAFANEILGQVPFPSIRADLEERIFVRLSPEEEVEPAP